jgi:hypothetical protein
MLDTLGLWDRDTPLETGSTGIITATTASSSSARPTSTTTITMIIPTIAGGVGTTIVGFAHITEPI